MSHEWKPGDVGAIPFGDGDVRALWTEEHGWVLCDDRNSSRSYVDVRPLIVIDPESDDDLDELCKALVVAMHRAGDRASAANGVHPATVAAALREFADPTPPKPDEPTGLGAVIEDAKGSLYVRVARLPEGREAWRLVGAGTHYSYAEITAVRVQAAGVA